MEKQPALICNDGLELEMDDTNNINEDTIYVTGFTVRWGWQLSIVIEALENVCSSTIHNLLITSTIFHCSQDNPLEFTYWRRMLREVAR